MRCFVVHDCSEPKIASGSQVDEGSGPDTVKVLLNVEEKGTPTLGTRTAVVEGEGRLELGLVHRNLFGRAEQCRGALQLGHQESSAVKLEFVAPCFHDSYKLHVQLQDVIQNFTRTCGFKGLKRGLVITTGQVESPHSVSYEICQRGVQWSRTESNPREISWKSALRHTYLEDSRDDPLVPMKGSFVRSNFEVAGWFCGNRFWRHQLDLQHNVPLGRDLLLSLSGSTGLLQSGGERSSEILERFFVGGPLSFRGFHMRGLGPREGDASAVSAARGGDAFFCLGASLSLPVPFFESVKRLISPLVSPERVRLHVFANAGNSIASQPGTSVVRSAISNLFSTVRSSVGVGVVFPTPLGRMEVNLCRPMVYHPELGDRVTHFQVGLGDE